MKKKMPLIATHNSVTGEKGFGLLSWFTMPFSRCQSKTLVEQYKSGCRLFDIRFRKSWYRKNFICGAHGLWETRKSLRELLDDLLIAAESNTRPPIYISLTYEGAVKYSEIQNLIAHIRTAYSPEIKITEVNIKLPKWRNAVKFTSLLTRSEFKVLDGHSWHTYIPIPWLWKKLYFNKPTFFTNVYTFVDFL